MRVLSLFSGIGAFEKALTNIGVDYELVNYCEIDRHASKSYSAIHKVSESLNLVDVSKVDFKSIGQVDLLTHGSPCQSFSIAGKQEGGDEGSGTRSSLMWYSVEAIMVLRPKVVVWENVKNVINFKHSKNAKRYLDTLEAFGYTNHCKVLNACDYGIPQNRERFFVVSTLGGANIDFTFPCKRELTLKAFDLIDAVYDNKYIVDTEALNKVNDTGYTNLDYGVVLDYRYDMGYRVRKNGLCPTLMCKSGSSSSSGTALVCANKENGKEVRTLTSKECFRFMGFSDEDYDNAYNAGVSELQLGKQAGNSIVVTILEDIFRELYLKGNTNDIDISAF